MKTSIAIGIAALAFAAGSTMGWTSQDSSKPKTPPAGPQDAAKQAEAEAMKVYAAFSTPGPEHARLARKVGAWELTVTFWPMPGVEPGVSKNTSTFAMDLGGRYLVERVQGDAAEEPWGKFGGLGVTAFNNGLKRFELSWMDTMGTGIMNGVGTTNSKGDITWISETYDPMQKKVTKVRGVERVLPDGSMMQEMFGAGPDGKEFKQMELKYVRKQ